MTAEQRNTTEMASKNIRLAGTDGSSVGAAEQPSRKTHSAQTATQMDREHFELHCQMIEFSAAVDAGAPRAEIFIRLTQLLEAFRSHFDSEENLMRSNNFPGFKSHADEHRKLMQQMLGLLDDVGSGVINRCGALAVYVRLWAEQHIAGLDAQLTNFLNEQEMARRGPSLVHRHS